MIYRELTMRAVVFVVIGVLACMLIMVQGTPAHADTNIDPVDKWAWSTNAGWVNFNPTHDGVMVYSDHLEGYAWAENIGWIRLGSYSGEMAHTYANTSPDDYGVNHDGAGNLSGYAWGTNMGWINFAPTHGGVTVDLDTGSLDGYAWSENVGWISFRGTGAIAYNVVVAQQFHGWPIPSLGSLGVVLLTLLLAGVGVFVLRKVAA
jgi:hypothetical protein